MADLDTLRWGDAKQLVFAPTGGRVLPLGASFQLVAARWRWPLAWLLRVVIVPAFAADETGTIVVDVQVTIGSGQNSTTTHFVYTVAPTAGVYPLAVNDLQQIPASDIQVTASISGNPGSASAQESITVGVYVAPVTEPHAMTGMYESMVEQAPQPQRWIGEHGGSHNNPGTGLGFQDEPLRYQPR